jgi:hypothetical protein
LCAGDDKREAMTVQVQRSGPSSWATPPEGVASNGFEERR